MTTQWMPLMGTGLAVRMDLLNEAQARSNHGQSLERLAERGGLSPCEALAIAENHQWRRMGGIEALKALAVMGLNGEVRGASRPSGEAFASKVRAAERERINALMAAIRAHWVKSNGEDSISVSALDVIAGVIADGSYVERA